MIRIGFRFGHRSTIGFDLIDRSVDWLIETVLAISFALIDVPAILQTELSTERFVIVWNPANLWSREQPSVTSDDLWSREELAVNFADLLTRCFFCCFCGISISETDFHWKSNRVIWQCDTSGKLNYFSQGNSNSQTIRSVRSVVLPQRQF